jgi:hypothetical protein
MVKLVNYTAEQLVFVDESAANEKTSNRKYGWGPVGVTPHEYHRFERSKRWSILPAYTINGFITWQIEHGSFTKELFEDFIRNVVHGLQGRVYEYNSRCCKLGKNTTKRLSDILDQT